MNELDAGRLAGGYGAFSVSRFNTATWRNISQSGAASPQDDVRAGISALLKKHGIDPDAP